MTADERPSYMPNLQTLNHEIHFREHNAKGTLEIETRRFAMPIKLKVKTQEWGSKVDDNIDQATCQNQTGIRQIETLMQANKKQKQSEALQFVLL